MTVATYGAARSDIALNGSGAPVLRPTAVTDLSVWAASATAAYDVAEKLVQTAFVPAQFKGKPYEATAAILAGMEVGLSPMASLRSFDVIQGVAAPRALTLRAIVQSLGHEVWVEESTESRALVKGRRRGSDREQSSLWTMDRARGLGLAGKDNWRKQPGAMLVARASAEVCRLVAADAILGIGYTVEELDDGTDATEITTSPAPKATTRTAQRRTRQTAGVTVVSPAESAAAPRPEPPEPDLPGEDDTDAAEPEDAEPISDAQLTKLHTVFTQIGWTDREDRLRAASAIVARTVASSKELTKAEASALIDTLEGVAQEAEPAEALAELLDRAGWAGGGSE